MGKSYQRTRVLITVMTYPHPSRGYREVVCTAGVTEEGEWVRLYPIDYRYRPERQRFKKYQWVEIDLAGQGGGYDNRKESRRPKVETIKLIGKPLSTKDNWRERRQIMNNVPVHTLNKLKQFHKRDKTSLGIVRPQRVLDLTVEKVRGKWKPQWEQDLRQLRLFGPPPKPLKKIPFKFSYVFECVDSRKPHTAMIVDWELGVLYLKEAARLGSAEEAAESVRTKFFKQMCSAGRDTCFFMGTKFPYNTWLVLGVFWPRRLKQLELGFWEK